MGGENENRGWGRREMGIELFVLILSCQKSVLDCLDDVLFYEFSLSINIRVWNSAQVAREADQPSLILWE